MIFTWNLDQQLNMTTETKHRQKNLKMTSFWQILTSLLFFRFMPDLEPSKSRIQDAQFVKLTFLLTVTFYFAKTQSRTKKYGSLNIALSKGTVFAKKRCFFGKNADISKIERPWYEKAYFLRLHMCVYLRTRFQVSSIILNNSNEF